MGSGTIVLGLPRSKLQLGHDLSAETAERTVWGDQK
jgi:hypothetical protein